jgi:hypothetical protein
LSSPLSRRRQSGGEPVASSCRLLLSFLRSFPFPESTLSLWPSQAAG